jgi:septation ring formation regulator EzrA
MSVITTANEAIEAGTTAAIDEALKAIRSRQDEVHQRWQQITSADHTASQSAPAGPERRKCLESGSPDELARLDDEQRLLESERDQLRHTADRLHEASRAAAKREAAAELPADFTELDVLLQAEADAQTALEAARAKADAHLEQIRSKRRLASEVRAKPETLSRYLELRNLRPGPDGHMPGLDRAKSVSHALGVPLQ